VPESGLLFTVLALLAPFSSKICTLKMARFVLSQVSISLLMKMTNLVRDGAGFPLDTPWKESTFITV
jgi:hypothetical protein